MSNPIIVHQFLTINGDGTGNNNANGDYSVTPATFFIQPASDEIMIIHELYIHLVNSGAFPATVYASLGAALTNGVDILLTNDRSSGLSILPEKIKTNDDFMHFGLGGFQLVNFSGGIDAIGASFKSSSFGMPITLVGSKSHKIEVILNDNLTGLVDHHFIAHGYK